MEPHDSWIDTDELAALGRQLLGKAGSLPESVSGAETDGGDPPRELVGRWKQQLAEIRARAERSGLVGEGKAAGGMEGPVESVPEAFVPPVDAPLVARMRAFDDWLAVSVRPRSRFGADELGFPILGSEGDPARVATALSLCRAWFASARKGMSAPSAMASRVLEDRGILSVFPLVEGETFRFVALVTERPLGSEAAGRISAAFRVAMGRG